MDAGRFSRLARGFAVPTLCLRAGIVGVNFGIMVALAWWLGLALFGDLMVIWGLAMLSGTVLSVGAPVLLLRVLSDGSGLQAAGFWRLVGLYPGILAGIGICILPLVMPGIAWGAVMLAGLAINVLNCLASLMRALGSVHLSMALRDGVPQLALGVAAVIAPHDVAAILIYAGLVLAGTGGMVLVPCLLHPDIDRCLRPEGDTGKMRIGLWANAVLGMATAQVDIILAGGFLQSEQVGLYALARRIANLVALPVSVATWVSARPIAVAYGAGDNAALRVASAVGNRITLLPGIVIMGLAVLALPFWQGTAHTPSLGLILLAAAMIQVGLASGFTVATLCGFERHALTARLTSLAVYGTCILAIGTGPSAPANALSYLAGIAAGGALLWWLLWRDLRIDTSAFALLRRSGRVAWKLP